MGPGSHLAKLFKKIGIKAAPGCACLKRARLMDQLGPDWCEQQSDLILDWLREETHRRGLPFVRLAASAVLWMAISRARKDAKQDGKSQSQPGPDEGRKDSPEGIPPTLP